MPPAFTTRNAEDVKISQLVGLETYKALYSKWPELYTYISDPLTPTNYYLSLVNGVVASSNLSYETAGTTIKDSLLQIINEEAISEENLALVQPLIDSSFVVKNLKNTELENWLLVLITLALSLFVIWYLYRIGFWNFMFNSVDGYACYDCVSIFDKLLG
jgi:hypothetical protein